MPEGPYDHPAIYDALHASGSGREATGLLRVIREFVGETGGEALRVLEPACGTGRLLRALARRGVRCVGLEIDGRMAAYARRRLARAGMQRSARVVVGDMRSVSPATVGRTRFDAAVCPDNSIRHLPSDAALVEHLRGAATVLRPGGVYVVGIGLSGEIEDFPSEQVTTVRTRRRAGGEVVISQVLEFLPPEHDAIGAGRRREMASSVVTVRDEATGRERQILSVYWLRTWTLAQWSACVRRAGMEELAATDLRGRDLGRNRTAYALRVLWPRRGPGL